MHRSSAPRVIILVDMDCFYAGVEQRERPELRGKPVVVVQGTEYKGGGIIAVSYEARTFGVTRMMRANEAKAKCPDLALCYVPVKHGKADLTRYRNVSAEVIRVVSRFGDRVERASVDEAFLDVTDAVQKRLAKGDLDLHSLEKMIDHIPNTFVCGYPIHKTCKTGGSTTSFSGGNTVHLPHPPQLQATAPSDVTGERYWDRGEEGADDPSISDDADLWVEADGGEGDDVGEVGEVSLASSSLESMSAWHGQCDDEQSLALLVGAVIASEMRVAVATEAGVSCSAGIAQNKMLAKLACGIHKPSQQTILPISSAPEVFAGLPFKKVRNLGGAFGRSVQKELNVASIGEVAAFTAPDLERRFGEKMGSWLFNISRGLCYEQLVERRLTQSLGSSKNFPGPKKLVSHEQIRYWLLQYSKELVERISNDERLNERRPSHLSVHALHEGEEKSLARSCQWSSFVSEAQLMEKAYSLLISNSRQRPPSLGPESERPGPSPWFPAVVNIGMCADQLKSIKDTKNMASITQFFQLPGSPQPLTQASRESPGTAVERGADGTSIAEVGRSRVSLSPERRGEQAAGQVPARTLTDCGLFQSSASSTQPSLVSDRDTVATRQDTVSELSATASQADDWQRCEKCGKMVSVWQLPEHLDFHFAQSLQAQERSSDRGPGQTPVPGSKSFGAPPAKRAKVTPKKAKQKLPSAPINSFFNKRT